MSIGPELSAEILTRRSSEIVESNMSRGELLRYIAADLENSDPTAARAIKTIADDIVHNCESVLDKMNLLMNEIQKQQPPH